MFVFCVMQDKLVVIYFLFQQSVLLNMLTEKIPVCQPCWSSRSLLSAPLSCVTFTQRGKGRSLHPSGSCWL